MTRIDAAEFVLPCAELQLTLEFFTQRLGFRLDSIFPADDPAIAQLSGHGLALRLERGSAAGPGVLRLLCADPLAIGRGESVLHAPNGTRIELVAARSAPAVSPPRATFVHTRMGSDASWVEGRAGMQYRDLLPGRMGGFLVASHIRIEAGGAVPDYVHYHDVQFQLIYCKRGWVRVVYEDQGPSFGLEAGDCVLQPPRIRHRVLECSAGLEVIELCAPSAHETRVDHELVLPTQVLRADRDFGGQRFVHHQRSSARWQPWRVAGFEASDVGIAAATADRCDVRVVRVCAGALPRARRPRDEFRFLVVLAGRGTLTDGAGAEALAEGDALLLPAGDAHGLVANSPDFELLETAFPAGTAASAG